MKCRIPWWGDVRGEADSHCEAVTEVALFLAPVIRHIAQRMLTNSYIPASEENAVKEQRSF